MHCLTEAHQEVSGPADVMSCAARVSQGRKWWQASNGPWYLRVPEWLLQILMPVAAAQVRPVSLQEFKSALFSSLLLPGFSYLQKLLRRGPSAVIQALHLSGPCSSLPRAWG